MGKEYRSIPVGVLAGTIYLVYCFWDLEFTIVNALWSLGEFSLIVLMFSSIVEAIISFTEKEDSIKGIVKVSAVVAVVIIVFAFLVKTRT